MKYILRLIHHFLGHTWFYRDATWRDLVLYPTTPKRLICTCGKQGIICLGEIVVDNLSFLKGK